MQNERFIVAIELGSSRAKIGVAGYDPDDASNKLTVYNVAMLPTTDSVRYGRVHNPRELTETVTALINEVQKKYPIEGRSILGSYLSLGGRTLKSHKINAELVLPERREITEELLERLENEAVKKLSTNSELITIEPVKFVVDNIPTLKPVGSLGTRLSGEFTAITCNPSNRKDLIDVIANRVGLNVRGISVRPLALAHLVLSPQETKAGCMLVDFGAESITVSIYKDYALQYLATIPIGSRLITQDLAKVLALTEEEAEKIKINQGNAMPEKNGDDVTNADLEKVNSIITARLADIVANINAQPGFAGVPQLGLPAGIILTGGGAKMRNFARLLESVMHLKVRIATLPSNILITDPDLSATDNIDLFALLNEGAELARKSMFPECVTPNAKPDNHKAENTHVDTTEKESESTSNGPEVIIDFTGSQKAKKEANVIIEPEEDLEFSNPFDDEAGDIIKSGFHKSHRDDEYDSRHWAYDTDEEEKMEARDAEKARKRKLEKEKKEKERLKRLEAQKIEQQRAEEAQSRNDDEEDKDDQISRIEYYIHKFTRILRGENEDNSVNM